MHELSDAAPVVPSLTSVLEHRPTTPLSETHAAGLDPDERLAPMKEINVPLNTPTTESRSRRRLLIAAAAVVVVIGVAGIALANNGDDDQSASPAAAATVAPTTTTSTTSTTSTTTTTTIPTKTDAEIAAASLLSASEFTDGWVGGPSQGTAFRSVARAPSLPECATYRDTVFNITTHPSTSAFAQLNSTTDQAGASIEVMVFPTENDAKVVVDAMQDPGFGACFAAVVNSAPSDGTLIKTDEALLPAESIAFAGDQSVSFSLSGTQTWSFGVLQDAALVPFVRAGRVVITINSGRLYVTDTTLQSAIAKSVELMRSAQGG